MLLKKLCFFNNTFGVIKDILKETYKNLLIGSYKRDVVYVKKPSRKSSKKSKTYKE